jgi:glycosyltransferase involved in cell wall biosynthesis
MSDEKKPSAFQVTPLDIQTYPRVLMVYMSCLNMADQHGESIRGWFAEWPRENLAQIYSGAEAPGEKFCSLTYKLGPEERNFGKLFSSIKISAFGKSSNLLTSGSNNHLGLKKISAWSIFLSKVSRILLNSGLWELVFFPRLSSELMVWIENFKPEVIYCQGYDLTFCWLPLMISKKYHIPIVFQTTDDWPNYLYKNSPCHLIVIRTAQKLIQNSAVRFAIGEQMALDYQKQFKTSFEILRIGDNRIRFDSSLPIRVVNEQTISIVYLGGLALGRLQSLLDLCSAVETLNKEGLVIKVTAFTTNLPVEAVNKLRQITDLQILLPPSQEQLPSILKGADILFLPETFDIKLAAEIRYSISSKSQLYMMSRKPIIVYGSSVTGVVDYAKKEGWAFVISERDISLLIRAIRIILTDTDVSESLVQKSCQVADNNHNAIKIRKHFLIKINEILKLNNT